MSTYTHLPETLRYGPRMQRRMETCEKYGVQPTRKNMYLLNEELLDQLDRCADDAARRLLLGVSK
jgi:hypothetical protein